MASLKPMLVLPLLVNSTLMAQEAKVTTVMSKDLTEFPGKEGMMITVDYPPGCSDPVHRHNAHAFLYVLEGRCWKSKSTIAARQQPTAIPPLSPKITLSMLAQCMRSGTLEHYNR
jgi:hypothetical protein